MPDDEVGRLNLLEYDALIRRKKQSDNRERFNAGLIAAAVLNCAPWGDPNREPASALDFVPDWKPKPITLDQMSPEQQKVFLMNMFFKRKLGSGKA